MSEQTQGSEWVEWAVMAKYRPPISTWPTREEAEAHCAAAEVSRVREDRELTEKERRDGRRYLRLEPSCYVASRRVTDWQRVGGNRMREQDKLREVFFVTQLDRCASIETAARKVIDAVDPLTPNEWAFEMPTSIREAVIELEAVLVGSNPGKTSA